MVLYFSADCNCCSAGQIVTQRPLVKVERKVRDDVHNLAVEQVLEELSVFGSFFVFQKFGDFISKTELIYSCKCVKV